ncbi:MAG: hypothetical protein ACREPA_10480, partial [Candidatus Dormibacteraceae bacterium]
MTAVQRLLGRVRRRLLAAGALRWAARGAAVAALPALGLELAIRRWPVDPSWPALVVCAAAGGLVAIGGWLRAWPDWPQVALSGDARMAGRERLTTTIEFAGAGAPLILRQRADAENWARQADAGAVTLSPWPWRTLALATLAALGAVALALVGNPALDRLRQERTATAAQARAAVQVHRLERPLANAAPAEDRKGLAALLRDLRQAEAAVRQAPNPAAAVAALSRAQQSAQALADPGLPARRLASAAAGAALASSPASRAGAALAAGDSGAAAGELSRLATG